MIRATSAALLSLSLLSSAALAQDGPLNRFGRALDQTGKNIRSNVETEVARNQITAQERDVLNRVGKRIDWDKLMVGSTLRLEVQPGGVVVLQGSVPNDAVRLRAVDLVQNTTGVTSVVDQLAVVKTVRVIEATPTPVPTTAIEVTTPPPVPAPPTAARVIVRP